MDLISRQAAIDIERNATVDTNPSHFEAHQKFTQFMDDAEISSFGRWQWSNGFNTALTAVGIDLKKLPSAQPEHLVKESGNLVNGLVNDCISRQAAIAHAVPLNLFGREVMMVSVSELENLPSVQPEYTEQDMREQFNAGYACGMHAAQPESKREWYMKGYRDAQANIVQCEDCKWRRNQNGTMAWIPCRALVTPDDFYCKYAERKEQ